MTRQMHVIHNHRGRRQGFAKPDSKELGFKRSSSAAGSTIRGGLVSPRQECTLFCCHGQYCFGESDDSCVPKQYSHCEDFCFFIATVISKHINSNSVCKNSPVIAMSPAEEYQTWAGPSSLWAPGTTWPRRTQSCASAGDCASTQDRKRKNKDNMVVRSRRVCHGKVSIAVNDHAQVGLFWARSV